MTDKTLIDMSTLTLAQAKAGHVALWDWLAKTGCRDKAAWPGWAEYTQVAINHCFACEVSYVGRCYHDCPVVWPGRGGCYKTVDGNGAILSQWEDADDIDTRRALAAQIRDLLWKEE